MGPQRYHFGGDVDGKAHIVGHQLRREKRNGIPCVTHGAFEGNIWDDLNSQRDTHSRQWPGGDSSIT